MKKTLILYSFLLGVMPLAGCNYKEVDPSEPAIPTPASQQPITSSSATAATNQNQEEASNCSPTVTEHKIAGIEYKLPHSDLVLTERENNKLVFKHLEPTDDLSYSSEDADAYWSEIFEIEKINKPITEVPFVCMPGGIYLTYNKEYDLWVWDEQENFNNWINDASNEYSVECKQRLSKRKDISFDFNLINKALAMGAGDACNQIIENDKMAERYQTKNNLSSLIFGCGDGGCSDETAFVESPDKTSVVKIFYLRCESGSSPIGNDKMIYSVLDSIKFIQ